MTPEQFKLNAISILKSPAGWQTRIARLLNITSRTVRYWLKEASIPDWVEHEFARLKGQTEVVPWPRDEWVIGTAFNAVGQPREYIYHAQYPRFIARIVSVHDGDQPEDFERPVDLKTGVVYGVDNETVLAEISFIDQLDIQAFRQWLKAAGDEIERVSEIEERMAGNLRQFLIDGDG